MAFMRQAENERLLFEKAKELGFTGYVWYPSHTKIEFSMDNPCPDNKQVMGYRGTFRVTPPFRIKVWVVYEFAPDLYEFQNYDYLDGEYEFFPIKLTLRRIFKVRLYLKSLKPGLKAFQRKMEQLQDYYLSLSQY